MAHAKDLISDMIWEDLILIEVLLLLNSILQMNHRYTGILIEFIVEPDCVVILMRYMSYRVRQNFSDIAKIFNSW